MQHWKLLRILHPAQGYYCSTVRSIVSTLDVLVTCMQAGTTVLRPLIPLPVRRSTDYHYKFSSLYKSENEKGSCTP
jgi:hypothetical protein